MIDLDINSSFSLNNESKSKYYFPDYSISYELLCFLFGKEAEEAPKILFKKNWENQSIVLSGYVTNFPSTILSSIFSFFFPSISPAIHSRDYYPNYEVNFVLHRRFNAPPNNPDPNSSLYSYLLLLLWF
jgi:hypothetical protein